MCNLFKLHNETEVPTAVGQMLDLPRWLHSLHLMLALACSTCNMCFLLSLSLLVFSSAWTSFPLQGLGDVTPASDFELFVKQSTYSRGN